ncbi:hypothetical protein F5J12DRAFT_951727 [Pisolithus orientalis]|uniref:uncharacterized protein n=1 Tax=Pisolithus orientalis TaxID=936130 RepID=UPI002225470C|nr:uncharacterized protein F5J12DRAFT_951727 [Pisolithus orientalis]KAI5999783.1 hypothetical protein F5J12DRAFT_951727 [Pisolithus orientalis]
MAPERTTGRVLQTAKIACIKFSPYPKPDIGEALELCFARKSLRGGAGVIHLNDARDGKFLFCNGIKDLPDVVIKEAVLMKHAGSWELREAEHYSNFMKYIYQANHKKYGEYLGDGQGDVDLDHAAEIDNVENFLAFGCEAYNEDIMTFQTMNTQLNQLEEEVQCHVHDSSSEFDGSSDCNASDRYVELGVNDSKDGLMGPFLPSSIAPTTMDWPIFRDEGYLELTGQANIYHLPSMDISYPPASLFDPSLIFAPHEIEQLTENTCHPELVISTHSTQSWMPHDRVFSDHIAMAGDRPNQWGEVARVQNSTQPTKHVHLPVLPTGDPPAANAPALVPVNLQPTATMCIPDYIVKRHIRVLRHTFKTIAQLTLKDSYNLCMPINAPHTAQITETWRTSVEPLLVGWDFVNKEVLLPTGQTVTSFFNCHAVSTIIHEAVFLPCHKLSSIIPPDTENLDHLIAFTITIIRWGLTNLIRGCEAEFEADVYEPHYNNALRHIQDLRSEGPITTLDCFSEFTASILVHGRELIEHYSQCT